MTETNPLPNHSPHYNLDDNKKQKFLELFRINPNFTQCAEAIGFTRQTFYNQLECDPEFKRKYDAVREGLLDNLEHRVYEFAQRPQNVIDRLAYLKAYRSRVWDPQRFQTPTVNFNVIESKLDKSKSIDAEFTVEKNER